MKTGQKGIDLIKKFEGLELKMYNCPAGHATIGYGYLVHKGPINGSESSEFKKGITEQRAEELLLLSLNKFEKVVTDAVSVDITQNQFDALMSFCYNFGPGNFLGSTLLKKVNLRDFDAASNEFLRWVYVKENGVKKVSKGLKNRRDAEKQLFLS